MRRVCRSLTLITVFTFACALGTAAPATNQMATECAAFANAFAKLVPAGGMPAHEMFDVEVMTERTLKLLPDRADERQKVRIAVQTAVEKMTSTLQGTKLHFLRVREVGGETRALIRVVGPDGSLNYLELICQMQLMKRIRAVDVYNLSSGETLTESLQRLMNVLDPQMSLFDRLAGKQREAAARTKAAGELIKSSQEGDHKMVVKRFNELPPELQRQKVFIILLAKSAANVGEQEYLAALKFWRSAQPNDPSIDLISIDAYFLQDKHDQALAAIDRLDTALGGDPYLDYMRAVVLRKMGKTEQADVLLSKALDAEEQSARTTARSRTLPAPNATYEPPPLVPPSVRMAARANSSKPMRLQGVFMRTGAPTAIIDGKNVAEGDVLNGNKIVKIEAQRVTLENEQGETFKLSYQ